MIMTRLSLLIKASLSPASLILRRYLQMTPVLIIQIYEKWTYVYALFFAAAPENGTSIELKCQEDPTDWVLDYNDRRAISSLVANCTINGLVDQILQTQTQFNRSNTY